MIIFFSDLHLHHTHKFSTVTQEGRTVREKEHLSCAKKIAELIEKHKDVERVVFGGDFFGPVGDNLSTQCLDTACEFVDIIQQKCIKYNIDFDMLVGNHDSSIETPTIKIHKLSPFKHWRNINVYDMLCCIDNRVYMPHTNGFEFAENFLNAIPNKENKIVFSHLDLKNVEISNEIFSKKGIDVNILKQFKMTLQGHYHSGISYYNNVIVCGSTQRLSFKDQGISRNNILLYYPETNTIKRESFDCPDWLSFNDTNINDILKIDDNNYVKLDITSDILLTPEIQSKLDKIKEKDIHIDITRISLNKRVTEEIKGESEIDVLKQFINNSNNTVDKKVALITEGNRLLSIAEK